MPPNESCVMWRRPVAWHSTFGAWVKTGENQWERMPDVSEGNNKAHRYWMERAAFEEWQSNDTNDDETDESDLDFCLGCGGELRFIVTQSGTLTTECANCSEVEEGNVYGLSFVHGRKPDAPFQMRRFFEPVHGVQPTSSGVPGTPRTYYPDRFDVAPSTLVKRFMVALGRIRDFAEVSADPLQFAIGIRWPNGVRCPHCDCQSVHFIATREKWRCNAKDCYKQFSIKIGTPMEGAHISLEGWLRGLWMLAHERNGITCDRLSKEIGVTYKSGLRLLHIARDVLALTPSENPNNLTPKSGGVLESNG